MLGEILVHALFLKEIFLADLSAYRILKSSNSEISIGLKNPVLVGL